MIDGFDCPFVRNVLSIGKALLLLSATYYIVGGGLFVSDDGWVSLELLLTFNRMRRMGLEVGRVAEVVRAGSKELEIDEAGRKVRRKAAYRYQG